MIFYETPLSSSTYEKTEALYSMSAVYSKVAFLKTETSLTLLIP